MAILKNMNIQLIHTKIKHNANTAPSSSEIAAKIKSCDTTGILSGMP